MYVVRRTSGMTCRRVLLCTWCSVPVYHKPYHTIPYHTTPGKYITYTKMYHTAASAAAPVFTHQVRFHLPIPHAVKRHTDSSPVLCSHYASKHKYVSHVSTRELRLLSYAYVRSCANALALQGWQQEDGDMTAVIPFHARPSRFAFSLPALATPGG